MATECRRCSDSKGNAATLAKIAPPATKSSELLNIPLFDRDGHPVVPT